MFCLDVYKRQASFSEINIEEIKMEIIAKIQTDFPTKFGIPRQSGLVESLKGVITVSYTHLVSHADISD